jgi:anti-anti-sigma regulatory factor
VIDKLGTLMAQSLTLDSALATLVTLAEAIPDAIVFAVDCRYHYTFYNAKHAAVMNAIWGVDIEVQRNMLEVIGNDEDRNKAKANFDQALSGNRVRMLEAYGDETLSRSYWDNTYDPIRDQTGQVIGVLVQCLDVSEKKRDEALIVQQRNELEKLIADRTLQLTEKVDLIQQLSAPIIPIWDGVLVVPLVGGLNEQWGERIMTDVLESIQRLATREILFDITGLRDVDAIASERLLRMISAAKLLGTGCAVVGVSPEVARMLVQIDAPLTGVPTYGTLRDGLRAALKRLSLYVVRREQ